MSDSILTLRDIELFIASAPSVFGFHPSESVVYLNRNSSSHFRINLPKRAEDVGRFSAAATRALKSKGSTGGVFLFYGGVVEVGPAALELSRSVSAAGLGALAPHWVAFDGSHAFRVVDGLVSSMALPVDISQHEVTLAAAFEGKPILESRAALEASLAPDIEGADVVSEFVGFTSDEVVEALANDPNFLTTMCDRVDASWVRLPAHQRPPVQDVAVLAVLAQFADVRAFITAKASIDWPDGAWRLAQLARVTPPDLAGALWLLSSRAALAARQGAMAWILARHARAVAPDNPEVVELLEELEQELGTEHN